MHAFPWAKPSMGRAYPAAIPSRPGNDKHRVGEVALSEWFDMAVAGEGQEHPLMAADGVVGRVGVENKRAVGLLPRPTRGGTLRVGAARCPAMIPHQHDLGGTVPGRDVRQPSSRVLQTVASAAWQG